VLDEFHLSYGDELTLFMEQAIDRSRQYKQKADGREGGAGYEGAIITSIWRSECPANDSSRSGAPRRVGRRHRSGPEVDRLAIFAEIHTTKVNTSDSCGFSA
jgi:hypothetical protein